MRHGQALPILFLIFLTLCGIAPAHAATNKYTIVLASAPGTNNQWIPRSLHALRGYTLYVTQAEIKGKAWERLNVGFFDSRKQAVATLKNLKSNYPGAWIRKVSSKEIQFARRNALKTGKRLATTKTPAKRKRSKPSPGNAKLDKLMRQAKTAFKKKQYAKAIRLFSAITHYSDNKYSQEALELQGLARQRKGQKAQAARVYEQYLKLYPDSEGAVRVKQRLTGLLTETRAPRKKLTLRTAASVNEFTTYGSISQFYRHDETRAADTGALTTVSQLITFADYTAIERIDDIEHRYQITIDNTYDFLDSRNKSEFRITELYYDISARSTGSSARIGRQSLRIGSLLNRFDGLQAGYQITPDIRINLIGGLPVETDNKTSFNRHKSFYGVIFESGTFLQHWNANLFHFRQTVDGVDDRISSGAEVQYRGDQLSVFSTVDYDSLYKTLNTAFVNATLTLNAKQSVHASVFMRRAPPLATSNALIGQTATSITELQQTLNLNIEQIHQLAKDRTADSKTATVGGTHKLRKNLQVNLDITLAHTGSTISSQKVPATPSTGTDFFISSQLVGNNLILKNDTGVLGFRYFNTKASDTLSLIANSRIPVTRNWRIYPRLQYDLRNIRNGGTQSKLRALFKTDYRLRRNVRFDLEIGYDDTTESDASQSLGSNSLFYTLGYRYDF